VGEAVLQFLEFKEFIADPRRAD